MKKSLLCSMLCSICTFIYMTAAQATISDSITNPLRENSSYIKLAAAVPAGDARKEIDFGSKSHSREVLCSDRTFPHTGTPILAIGQARTCNDSRGTHYCYTSCTKGYQLSGCNCKKATEKMEIFCNKGYQLDGEPDTAIGKPKTCKDSNGTHYCYINCASGYKLSGCDCVAKTCNGNYHNENIPGCVKVESCTSSTETLYTCTDCDVGWKDNGKGGCKPAECKPEKFPYKEKPATCENGYITKCPEYVLSEDGLSFATIYKYGCNKCDAGEKLNDDGTACIFYEPEDDNDAACKEDEILNDEGKCVRACGNPELCNFAPSEIFDGKGNTQKIVAQMGNEALAAYACTQFYAPGVEANDPTFGQGKWYLPALGELMELNGYDPEKVTCYNYTSGSTGTNYRLVNEALKILEDKGAKAKPFGGETFADSRYWSSTEKDKKEAWIMNELGRGGRTNVSKTASNTALVRSFLFLENAYNPSSNSIPSVGNVMYADKTWGIAADYDGSKVAVGVITHVSNTGSVTVISLKNLKFTNAKTVGNFDPADPYGNKKKDTIWLTSETDITTLTNFSKDCLDTALQTSIPDTLDQNVDESRAMAPEDEPIEESLSFAVTPTSEMNKFKFEMGGGPATIDWGDGSIQQVNKAYNGSKYHTYSKLNKEYVIKITGQPTKITPPKLNISLTEHNKIITRLINIYLPSLTELGLFEEAYNMTGDLTNMKFPPNLRSAPRLFQDCAKLTGKIPQLPESLTFAYAMFSGCENLTGEMPDLPENLKSGHAMFANCKGLTGNIKKLPDSMTDAYWMFAGCEGLTGKIPQLPSGLIDGEGMFAECPNLTGFDFEALPDTLEDTSEMFKFDTGLTGKVPALPSGMTDGLRMFYGCSNLTGFNFEAFPDNLSQAASMFYGCSSLSGSVPELPSNLMYAQDMFNGTTNLSGKCPKKPAKLHYRDTGMFKDSGVTCSYGK